MQQGKEPASLFLDTTFSGLYPRSITGVPGLGYLFACSPVQLGGPFGFCAFALLAPFLPGSLEIALKRTRPRQRFYYVGRDCMTEGGGCQEEIRFRQYLLFDSLYL